MGLQEDTELKEKMEEKKEQMSNAVKEHKTEFDLAQAREAAQKAESSAKAAQAEQQKA